VNKLLQLALVIGLAACGPDDHLSIGDGGTDAGPPSATLTTYVKDLIENHTSDQAPRPYAEFSGLPDPDGDSNNTTAYGSLFQ
jgi:hypothetical protein